ncbi:MAG TPA: nuclear transport factor 2 family protein [Thermoanaerobaculia bacterium]|nr:nuclear transport factor 2 family protein [Thermoanaerobaculia bacterium]
MSIRDSAVEFLRLTSSGHAREAYDRFAAPDFKHHNPYFRGDAASLREAMEKDADAHPNKTLTVQHAIAEGDLVAVHSWVRMHGDDAGYALVHIFRFDGDRVAELWDIAAPVPPNSPNENGMF